MRFHIDGLAFWAPALPGWDVARAAFRNEGALADPPAKRPAPQILAPAERRRAPDSVALALEVAMRAVESSGHAATDLASVFTSAHGDLAVNDYMCSTLASGPTMLSPTKFHNSVHNAAAGYWTIGTGCMQSSTALTAYECSFAAGLLEAATQCVAESRPVLLVAYDIEAIGALATVTRSSGMLAAALVIAPQRSDRSTASVDLDLCAALPPRGPHSSLKSTAAAALAGNAMADALLFFEALACASTLPMSMPLSSLCAIEIKLQYG